MRIDSNMNRVSLAVALAAFMTTGCKIQKPSTPVPASPTIDSFTVSKPDAEKGDQITLTWKTSNATSIELREATAGDLGVAINTLEGSHAVTLESDALFVLTARGEGGTDARAVSVRVNESSGDAVTLQALPPTINGGAHATLVWTAPGATAVTITANGQPLSTGGQLATGAVDVRPLVDTTYVLAADGRTAQTVITVTPVVLSLDATPRAARSGGSVTVAWTAAGAERVVVSSPGRGQLHEATSAADVAAGSFADTLPELPNNSVVTYVIEAVKGTERAERRVEVNVGTGVAITRFDAPSVASAGGTYQVRWETAAADTVELKVDGATVYRSPTTGEAISGLFAFPVGPDDFAIEIVATNSLGDSARRLSQVDTVGVPTSATLTASPTAAGVGQAVTLTWSCAEARRVRITDSNGVAVFGTTGQGAEGGTATVHPSATTTYTLVADNLLGSSPVSAAATVTVTGAAPTVTQYPPTPLSGQMLTISTASPGATLHGFPHAQVLTSTQSDFRDISTTGARLLETGSDVTTVTLPFSTWLFGSQQTGPLTVSRAGWMAFGAPNTVLTSESSLPSSSAPSFVIAPYWDDLTLIAGSAVYAQVVGNAPNETLIVQWDKLRVGTTAASSVTFQAQVSQRGVIAFHYKTMTLNSSPSFSIGVQDGTRTRGVRSTVTPTSNSAQYFFSPVVAPIDLRATRGTVYGGFVQDGDTFTLVSQSANAVTIPQDLALTEFMFRPADAVGNAGQFLEVQNNTSAPLDLTGWELRVPNQPTFFMPAGFSLAPGVPTVIGGSLDPALNDDAGVTLSWEASGFSFPQDGGSFLVTTADAGTGGAGFTYTGPADGGRGFSLNVDPGPFVGTTGSPGLAACPATTPYGFQVPQQLGTPGRNSGCGFRYTLKSIPVNFVDISDGGVPLNVTGDNGRGTVVFGPDGGSPLPVLFGDPVPWLYVNSNGYFLPASETSGSHTNKVNAGSSAQVGSIALFWDDLDTVISGANVFMKYFPAGSDPATPAEHWVVQFHRYEHFLADDDLNFEAKFFSDGSLEYHYGSMVSGTSSNYGNGNSATIWLENPAGTQALVVGVNQPVITPFTAYRFTPR
ncbi:MAG: hypothetical protein DI536_16040 [Archangium gephyra]|uniref:LTD domain-containing protein n=1 Tax=Archangium gephyra TaxID=48 RepID=A0A2W5TKK9_9BACT|nr:MAG: hypothetical protein DI536_16040 [Archangium gephyra]